MEEEKSLLSQKGFTVIDPIRFTIAVKKANGLKNFVDNSVELEQKALQEQASKEISIEDYQSFANNVNTYINVFEQAFLDIEKDNKEADPKVIKEVEAAIQNMRNTLSSGDEFRGIEEDFKKQKDSFDEIKKQIIEWRSLPIDEAKKDSRNQSIEKLAEQYGAALDKYKEAKQAYDSKKADLKKHINDTNIQDMKNELFHQLVIIEDNFNKSEFYHIYGVNEALQALKGGIEMEIGMFGISLGDDSNTRSFEEFCKRSGIQKTSAKTITEPKEEIVEKEEKEEIKEAEEVIDDAIKDSIKKSAGLNQNELIKTPVDEPEDEEKQAPPVSSETEDDIRNKIIAGLDSKNDEPTEVPVSTSEATSVEESVPVSEPVQQEGQESVYTPDDILPYIDNSYKKPEEEQSTEEQKKDSFTNFFDIPNIEEPAIDNPFKPLIPEENESVQPPENNGEDIHKDIESTDDKREEDALLDSIVTDIPFNEQPEAPEVKDAAYEPTVEEQPVEEQNDEVEVKEYKETVEAPKPTLKQKIKGVRKSVSNKYLKAVMQSSAISGIAMKFSNTSSKVSEAVITAGLASSVKKLGDKMKNFGQLNRELFVNDDTKPATEQVSDIFATVKDKFLVAYSSIKTKIKQQITENASQHEQYAEALENQLKEGEGVAR